MKTSKRLNCYVCSNLIISFLSLNLLVNNDTTKTLNVVHNNSGNTLNEIYEIKKDNILNTSNIVSTNNVVTTISVTKKSVQTNNISYIKPSYNSVTGNSLVNYAKHYLGLRYVHAGNSLETGTDCSGFTKLIYKEFGISLGRTVNSQIYSGTYVSKNDLEPGDLVFYGYSKNKATHVGIYMGSNLVIHQSNPSDGVKINSVNMMVYITARRVITANIENVVELPSEKEDFNQEVQEEISNNVENVIDENIDISINENTSDNIIDDNTDFQLPNEVIDDTKEEVKEEVVDETLETDNIVDNIEIDEVESEIETEVVDDSNSLNETETITDTNELFKSEEIISSESLDSSVTSIDTIE